MGHFQNANEKPLLDTFSYLQYNGSRTDLKGAVMNGMRKITLSALLTAILLTGTSCGHAETVSLTDSIFTDADYIERSAEVCLVTDGRYYLFSNQYHNISKEIQKIMAEHPAEKMDDQTGGKTIGETALYFLFRDAAYHAAGFTVYENDVVIDQADSGARTYYECDGIYEALSTHLAPMMETQDAFFEVRDDQETITYAYHIHDIHGNTLAEDISFRQPYITQETEEIVCLWMQTGTGISTRWSQYFNIRTGEISPVYYGQTDSFGTMTSNTGNGCVIVSDIFTGEEIMTVDEWGQPLGECNDNIRSAYFSEDGRSLEVTCLDTNFEEFDVIVPITQQ